jgi:hypothetical protein
MKVLRNHARAFAVMLTLVVSSSLVSCMPDDRTAPPMAPQFSHTTEATRPVNPGYVRINDRLPDNIPSLQASQVIGLSGGSVHIAGHTLSVPAGAVEVPTVFTLTVVPNGTIEVELKAFQGLTNVGAQGFARPIPVTLTYARATNATEPSRLSIMRIKDSDATHEVLPSVVSANGKTVTAHLSHFSRYCMVAD